MSARPTLHVMTPRYKPIGGIVKIMDYVTHALAHGYRVSVWCPERWYANLPLFEIERFAALADHPDVTFGYDERLAIGPDDLVFLSLPASYEVAYRSLPAGASPERIIHIIQNTRHVNPTWGGGYPLRLLTRPAARISINDIVADTIAPWLDPRSMHEVIPLGHDLAYFRHERRSGDRRTPLRVAYTAWKSDIGDQVASRLADDGRFTFRGIHATVGWSDLRDLYRWADVFLSSPNAEEGLYLPGIEAMAAGCLVVTPDVGGNMAYCRPEENCLLAGFEDLDGYVAALERFASMSDAEVERFRAGGYAATAPFDLDAERASFGRFLDAVQERAAQVEPRGR